jgi:hypothetical protein
MRVAAHTQITWFGATPGDDLRDRVADHIGGSVRARVVLARSLSVRQDRDPTDSGPCRLFPAAKMNSAAGKCAQTLQFGRPYFVPAMQRATPGILTLPSSS